MLPSPCDDQQLVKLLEQVVRGSFLIVQFLALGSANLSLDTILVEVVKQFLRAFTHVQGVETVNQASAESGLTAGLPEDRPDLDVLPFVSVLVSPHVQ